MKILTKALILSTLGFMFVFLCVGYAQFTTSLDVDGNVDVNVPEGLFITDMTELSTSNIDRNDYYFVPQTTNVVNRISRGTSDELGVVVYEVTIYNNTDSTYYYRDIYYQTGLSDYNGNDYITEFGENTSVSIECIFGDKSGNTKKLLPRESIVFDVVRRPIVYAVKFIVQDVNQMLVG